MNPIEKLQWIHARLGERFGEMALPDGADPVETLVVTILSQNTTDVNRDRAYGALRRRFPTFDRVAEAPVEEVAHAIRPAGLHRQKAGTIHAALERIREEAGRLDLGFLEPLPSDEAMEWLQSIPGVGPKTAGIVLLFALGKPFFPVDTHIRRVTRRVGLIRGSEDPHRRLNALLPPDCVLMRQLHLLVIHLGRHVCHPRTPNCRACPIAVECVVGGRRSPGS